MTTTVIIPTFNRASTLPRAIRSLLRQGHEVELDILVVDDGSTDDTQAVLAQLQQQHGKLRVVHQPNAGVAGARNAGLANLLPDTEFVSFLDSDDVSPQGRFAADLPHLLRNTTLDLTYGRMMLVDVMDDEQLVPGPASRQVEVVGIHLSAGIFRRSVIDKVGLFDTSLRQAEDTDYLLRVFEANLSFVQTDTLCLYYWRHPGNMTRDTAESARCFARAIHKSILRRKANPAIVLNKPQFALKPLQESGFF